MTLSRPGAVLVLCALAAACTRDKAGGSLGTPTLHPADEAVRLYGYGPQPNPRVKYQPDVVLMSDGPRIVRGVSDDGITWTLDPDARGARELVPGKIMFASAHAVGRVVEVQRREAGLEVTLAPVAFTELIRDANLKVDQPLTRVSHEPLVARALEGPDEPRLMPAVWYPGGRFQQVVAQSGSGGGGTATVQGFEVQPFIKSSGKDSDDKKESVAEIGVKISRKASDKVKFGATASLYGKNMRVRANLVIVEGVLQDSSVFTIEGADGLDVGFVGGSEDAVVLKLRLEDTLVDDGVNFVVDGVPMALTWKAKAYLENAYSSKNASLWTHGRYRLTGPIGYRNGTFHKPTLTVEKSMMDSLGGVTIGPAAVVFATELRAMLGVGMKKVAVAGPYARIVFSVGASRGSALGLPIADCRALTLKLDGGVGVGLEFNSKMTRLLEMLDRSLRPQLLELKKKMGKSKFEIEFGQEDTLFNRTMVRPNIRLCGGGEA